MLAAQSLNDAIEINHQDSAWHEMGQDIHYALVEPLLYPDLLPTLYREQDQFPVHQVRLLDQTPWQSAAEGGPVIVQLSSESQTWQKLTAACSIAPVASFWRSDLSFEDFTQWAREHCQAYDQTNRLLLLRFHEPRQLMPFTSTLGTEQIRRFFNGINSVQWYDRSWYRAQFIAKKTDKEQEQGQSTANTAIAEENPPHRFTLTQQHLDAMSQRRASKDTNPQ